MATIITPEVFADAVNAALGAKLRVAKVATDFTDMVDDITTCGDKVHFPMIDRITDADVVTKGTPLVPDEVNMTDSTAEIKQVAKSARIYDKDSIQVKGTLKDKLATQLGESMAKSVDADLVNSIRDEATYKEDIASEGEFTEATIEGAFDVFGADVDNDTFAGILVSDKLRKAIVGMSGFTKADFTYANSANGIIRDGVIGYWRGTIPVILSDNGTYKEQKALLAIVKKEALGVVWQKLPTIEEDRESKLLATDLVASEMYATKLVRTDGVSVLEVKLGGE